MGKMPWQVDAMPFVMVGWLTSQLVEHESNAEKWWKQPYGFNLLDAGLADDDPFMGSHVAPPPGWERLPMEEPLDGE